MSRVLVLYYSQSGDVRSALEALTAPIRGPDVDICWRAVGTDPMYAFPWRARDFFDCMPEAVNGEPPRLAPIELDPQERFDLVVIGWQVWFLSPSLPVQAFFAAPEAQVLRGARVISVTCCRQMWQRAHAQMRALIAGAGGVLTDSVVVTHQGGSLAGYLTAPRLMLTGRREKGVILPAAGVAHDEVQALGRFGQRLRETRARWTDDAPAPLLADLAPVRVNTGALLPEMAGVAVMTLLARAARLCGGPGSMARRPVIWLFMLSLAVLVPFVLVASVLLTPVLRRVFARRLTRYVRTVQGGWLPPAARSH